MVNFAAKFFKERYFGGNLCNTIDTFVRIGVNVGVDVSVIVDVIVDVLDGVNGGVKY